MILKFKELVKAYLRAIPYASPDGDYPLEREIPG
jgi:hypothetical protein